MKKRRLRVVTIAALLAALFGSGGGIAWGQTVPDCNNDYGADEWAKISTPTSTSPFYPTTPAPGTPPLNSSGVFTGPTGAPGTWAATVPVAFGSRGRITLGGNQKQNVIYHIRNYPQAGLVRTSANSGVWNCYTDNQGCGNVTYSHNPTTPLCSNNSVLYNHILYSSWSPSGLDNGTTSTGVAAQRTSIYNRETQVRILGNPSGGAWVEMDHILMENIEWWYNEEALSWQACTFTGYGCNWRHWTDSHGNPQQSCDACSHQLLTGYTSGTNYGTHKGGNVDGHVMLELRSL